MEKFIDTGVSPLKRPFEISEQIYPFTSKWTKVQDQDIHYIDEGTGPAILFCHGNPTWSLLYSQIIQNLRSDYRCIALDYPGFGMSSKPDISVYGYTPPEHSTILEEFVDQIIPDKFSIFVQDWGGPIGLGMAAKIPDRIEKMIIGNTWAWPQDENSAWYEAAQAFSAKMGGPDAKERIMQKNTFLKISMGQLTAGIKKRNPELKDELQNAWLAPFPTPESRLPTWVFPGQIIAARGFLKTVQNNLPELLNKKTLLVWGMQDRVFPPLILDDWQKMLSNYTLLKLPDANHFFQLDEPDQISNAIRELFK